MKVFVSLPMHERSEDDVMQEMRKIFGEFREWNEKEKVFFNNEDDPYILIDNYHKEGLEGSDRLVYLGDSIAKMAAADVVIFAPGWREARGCQIEMAVVKEYHIPYGFYQKSNFTATDKAYRAYWED